MSSLHLITAAVLLTQAFTLFAISAQGRQLMSQQAELDNLTALVKKGTAEVVGLVAALRDEIAAGVPAEQLDLTGLSAAAQALDDIVPDVPEVADELPADVPVE